MNNRSKLVTLRLVSLFIASSPTFFTTSALIPDFVALLDIFSLGITLHCSDGWKGSDAKVRYAILVQRNGFYSAAECMCQNRKAGIIAKYSNFFASQIAE